jgi:lipid A 3-O-deacylase
MIPSVCTAEPLSQPSSANSEPQPQLILQLPETSIWQHGVGEGFRAKTQTIGLGVGGSYGLLILGSKERHELALISISYGYMLGGVQGTTHWYRGNWEVRAELFSGAQFYPDTGWVLGLTPHLRYNFATGTRWIPFIDIGAGATATDIRGPDLGGPFEFNLQGGAGLSWFVKDNMTISLEGRYMHFSSAHIYEPNLGLNTAMGFLGVNWFF